MCDDVPGIGQVYERHVLDSGLDVRLTLGAHGDRLRSENVVENRDIMGGKIPDDVDVLLEKPEIHACRVDVVNVSKFS